MPRTCRARSQQRPATLSGGERQRLAIARALVLDPALVLLDEPLANLDIVLKSELLDLFRRVLIDRGTSVIYVTHDPREALGLTSEFAVLEEGIITQRGSFEALVRTPATNFIRKLAAAAARS